MKQLGLFGDAVRPPEPQPQPLRREPLLWMARLLILREPQLAEESVIRAITLRRGLNILWAPPASPADGNRLFDGKITGHTAGKTTFCRMIRYLLGEQRFGNAQTQERIREQLAHGWVVGEVFVGGERWVVGRPFALGIHPFAARGISIEEGLRDRGRGGYQDFLAAAALAAVSPIPVKTLPHARQPVQWDHVLAWLTRDQEARFAGLAEWRDPASESESPKLTIDDRHVVVRALLGLMFEEEGEAQRKYEELSREKQKLEEDEPHLRARAAEDRRRLTKLFDVKDDAEEAGPLFGARLHEHIAERRAALKRSAEALAARGGEAEQAFGALKKAAETCGVRLQQARDAEARLARLPRRAAEAEGESAESVADVQGVRLALHGANSEVCSVPLHLAVARGCPLAAGAGPSRSAAPDGLRAAEQQAGQERGDAAEIEGEADLARRAVEEAQAEQQASQERYLELNAELQRERERQAEERAAIEEIGRLWSHLRAAQREIQESARRLGQVASEAREWSDRQVTLRREHAEALGRLTDGFCEVVRAFLGSQVDGRVEVRNRRIELHVDDRGERDGAAMTTIKLLAFDLAALKLGTEGHGRFPSFLVHDGPREADMDGQIYERLFMYARGLEDRFPGQPAFQYIVTTTAPPPLELQEPPWRLDPLLDASVPEGRLLRMDL